MEEKPEETSPIAAQLVGRSTIDQWLGKPWWGFACVCFGVIGCFTGAVPLLSAVIGKDISDSLGAIAVFPMLAMLVCAALGVCAFVARLFGRAVPKSKQKRWLAVAGLLIACGIGLQTLALLIPATQAAHQAAANAANENQPWNEHSFGDGEFTLSTPASWQLADDPLNVSGSIYLLDQANDLHAFETVIPRTDTTVSTLDELAKLTIDSYKERLQDVREIETVVVQQDGVPVADTTFVATIEATNLFYHVRHLEFDNHWVELQVWAVPSRFDANGDVLRGIINSVAARN